MRGETAGFNHCSTTRPPQLVQIINPNHHPAKAPPPQTPARLPASHCALIGHYSTMAASHKDTQTLKRKQKKTCSCSHARARAAFALF